MPVEPHASYQVAFLGGFMQQQRKAEVHNVRKGLPCV